MAGEAAETQWRELEKGATWKGKQEKKMGLVHAFGPFCCSLLIWLSPSTLGAINFSVDG